MTSPALLYFLSLPQFYDSTRTIGLRGLFGHHYLRFSLSLAPDAQRNCREHEKDIANAYWEGSRKLTSSMGKRRKWGAVLWQPATAAPQNPGRESTNEVAMAGEPCKRIIDTKQDASAPRPSIRAPGAVISHTGICEGGWATGAPTLID